MPKFSIIIPLYNKEKYITSCLKSVIQQTYCDFEIIVVDDGSLDDGVNIIKRSIHDERLQIITQKNSGPSAARNTGIKAASGDWIVFLDADDCFLPSALKTFNQLLESKPGFLYYICNYYLGSKNKYILYTEKKTNQEMKAPFFWEFWGVLSDRPGSAMYKRELLINHLFNEKIRRYEDAESQYEILNKINPYQSSIAVMISFRDFSEAATFRKNIDEDFAGHLDFKNKSFWECMVLYKIAREARRGYGRIVDSMYRRELKRIDYKFVYLFYAVCRKIMHFLHRKKEYLYENIIEG